MPTPHDYAIAQQLAEEICRRVGARLTRLRRNVFMAVLSTEHPVTAYEILDLLRPKDPLATPAGIYRSLDFLTELGSSYRVCQELHRLCDAGSRASHQMLVCRRCGMVVETEDSRVARATESLGRRLGFALDRNTIEFVGLCSSCRG